MRAPLTIIDAIMEYPQLTRVSAVIIVELTNAKGRIIGRQMLRDALEAVVGNRTTDDALTAACKHARRAIKGHGSIVSIYGVGYKIEWNEADRICETCGGQISRQTGKSGLT